MDDERPEVEDNGQTIRPTRSPGIVPTPLPLAKPPAEIEPIVEDISEFDFAEDDDNLQAKVADFKVSAIPCFCSLAHNLMLLQMKNSFRKGLFHPDDIRTVGLMPPSPGPKTAPLPGLSHKASRPSLNPLPPSGSSTPGRGHQRSSSFVNGGSAGRAEARRLHSQPEFGKYTEYDEDEDYEDIFDKAHGACECDREIAEAHWSNM